MFSNRTAWYDLIKSKQPLIKAINYTLTCYKTAYLAGNHTKDLLQHIINASELFLRTVPKSERTKHRLFQTVLTLQKNAVTRWLLPEAKNDALARWKLMKNLMISTNNEKSYKGVMLRKEYWPEYAFKGFDMIPDWKKNGINESFADALARDGCVEYVNDPNKYRVEIKDGLYYFNDKLLSTEYSSNYHQRIKGAVIYAADFEGTLYISHPEENPHTVICHSSLLQGRKVLCAGKLEVFKGVLLSIDTDSGHYTPSQENLDILYRLLKEKREASRVMKADDEPEDLLQRNRCCIL